MINGSGRHTPNSADKGHYFLSKMADNVKTAGKIGIDDGKITYLDNWSGHYRPSGQDLLNSANFFNRLNLVGKNLELYKMKGSK